MRIGSDSDSDSKDGTHPILRRPAYDGLPFAEDADGEPSTFAGHLARHVIERGDESALRHKIRGRWQTWTWRGLAREVATFSAGLGRLGFVRGDLLALVGGAGPRQLVAALAAQQRGGVAHPVDHGLAADGLRALLDDGDIRFAFASNEAHVERIFQATGGHVHGVSGVPPVIVFDDPRGLRRAGRRDLHDYEAVCESGRFTAPPTEDRGERSAFCFWPADSGAELRATVLTHQALLRCGRAIANQGSLSAHDEVLAGPPLASPGAPEMIATWLVVGSRLSFPEVDGNVDSDRHDILPTYLFGSADAYQTLWRDVSDRLPSPGTRPRRIFDAALRHGARRQRAGDSIRRPTDQARLVRALGDACIMRPLARALGLGRVRVAFTLGADPLGADAGAFLSALDIPVRFSPLASRLARGDEGARERLSGMEGRLEPSAWALP